MHARGTPFFEMANRLPSEKVYSLVQLWAAISNGLLAVDAFLRVLGPRPVEPSPECDDAVYDVYMAQINNWESARSYLITQAGIVPGTLHAQRNQIESELKAHLWASPSFEDGCDDIEAELRMLIAQQLAGPLSRPDPELITRVEQLWWVER